MKHSHPVINFLFDGIITGLFVIVILHAVSKALDIIYKWRKLKYEKERSRP